ncbi:putative phospholipase B-like 2 [Patella vulgata]|uniref:putative phospholipase B-like 2 n=1 Tax=Patella vulgata TaxID=6465 RepID=UPI0024A7F3F2|nr:putative phospholipase B-like 2 [Patella vulgata]
MGMFDTRRNGGGTGKVYAISRETVPGRVLTFSSYPGALTSGDDYYLLSSGMVSMETTIGNSNSDLWRFVQPTVSVLEGVRSVVANRIAKSGMEWASTFATYNSGTYNNEWMIVDYKQFQRGNRNLKPGLLVVLEQIPGMVTYQDLTALLQTNTYFASYNVAYFPGVFNASGGNEMVKKYGDWFSYNYTARANIFRRDHGNVRDIDSMMKLMRYNDYTKDPLSRCNCTPPYSAENAISARSDLNPANGTFSISALGHRAHGGIDMKLTNFEMFKTMEMVAIGGPTYDNLPPFQWSQSDFASHISHLGHPDKFMFKPIRYNGTVPAAAYP